RDHPRAAGGRRESGRHSALLRRPLRRLDPPGAATPRIQSARLAPSPRRGHCRARGDGRVDVALDPSPARCSPTAGRRRRGDERANSPRAGERLVIGAGALVAAAVIGAPALVFVLWPLLGRERRGRTFLPLPPDRRQELDEEKKVALAAIRELEFEPA